jgi:uncharacterized membrane protein
MDIWSVTIRGVDFYHILNWFLIYSFLGWVWETTYVSLKQGHYVNRGFVNGPLCTIYGCGAIAVYLILLPFEENILFLFLGGIVVATVLEYLTAVLMESIFHTSWWDYSDKKFNFQGRICLGASLGWGCFSVILFRVFQPVVEDVVALYTVKTGKILCVSTLLVYSVDFATSAAAAFQLRSKLALWENELEEKRGELLVNLNQKLKVFEDSLRSPLSAVKEHMEEYEIIRQIEEKRIELRSQAVQELSEYKRKSGSRFGHNANRFLKAYPNLNRGYRLRHMKRNKNTENTKK